MAQQGLKVDKGFRPTAFNDSARAVNERFVMDITKDNVANHANWLQKRYKDIKTAMQQPSGVGWEVG